MSRSHFTRSRTIQKINKYTLCFWSRTTVKSLTLDPERGGQTMSVCPNMGWSRPGGNCCVQSMTAGLKRPQQRSWKKETRFRTTPKLQRQTDANGHNMTLWCWMLLASYRPATAIKPFVFQVFSYISIFVFLARFCVERVSRWINGNKFRTLLIQPGPAVYVRAFHLF